jgi:hypothetical protein
MNATELETLNRLSAAVENLTKAIVKLESKIDRLTTPGPVKAFPSSQPGTTHVESSQK